jgi:hypothetical protein
MVCRRVEINVNPGVIARLFFGHDGPLAMKDENRLKWGITVSHDVKDYSSLPLVPTTAVRLAGYDGYPLPIISIAA